CGLAFSTNAVMCRRLKCPDDSPEKSKTLSRRCLYLQTVSQTTDEDSHSMRRTRDAFRRTRRLRAQSADRDRRTPRALAFDENLRSSWIERFRPLPGLP